MPSWDLKDKAAVCGVGHSPYGKRLNRSTLDRGGVANADIAIGMPVEIVYDDVTDEATLAKFRPARK